MVVAPVGHEVLNFWKGSKITLLAHDIVVTHVFYDINVYDVVADQHKGDLQICLLGLVGDHG